MAKSLAIIFLKQIFRVARPTQKRTEVASASYTPTLQDRAHHIRRRRLTDYRTRMHFRGSSSSLPVPPNLGAHYPVDALAGLNLLHCLLSSAVRLRSSNGVVEALPERKLKRDRNRQYRKSSRQSKIKPRTPLPGGWATGATAFRLPVLRPSCWRSAAPHCADTAQFYSSFQPDCAPRPAYRQEAGSQLC